MTAIKLDKVSFRYPGVSKWALSEVSLKIPQGSFYALLGPNGAGKTTMLRLLCGRFSCFRGTVQIADAYRAKNGFLNPECYGVLLENPGIYPKLSIQEYVEYFLGFYGFGDSAYKKKCNSKERIETLAQKLELPDLSTKMSALSLGNRQKVQLLRTLAPCPKLLILDEPVANLDPMSREAVWHLIAQWRKQEGGTAIVCSHILAEMESEATDFAIIDKGTVLKQGRVSELASDNGAFQLELPQNVTEEQVRAALKQAGLLDVHISQAKSSLSELYRNTVQ